MALPAGSVLALQVDERVMANSARSFSGTSMYLNRSSPEAILRGQSGAIWRSVWVYVDTDAASDTIVECAGASAGWRLYIDGSLNMVASFINTSSAAQNAQQAFTTGAWHHVAFGYDGTNVWIRVDGATATTTAFSGTYAAETTNQFVIGGRTGGSNLIDAQICQVIGDDGDLTDAQYLGLYNGGMGESSDTIEATLGASAPGFGYALQESSGAAVDWIGGLDLTDNGSVGSAAGVSNDAATAFDGTGDNYSVADSANFDYSATDFTVITLLKTAASHSGNRYIHSKFGAADADREWRCWLSSSGVVSTTKYYSGGNTASTDATLSTSTWYTLISMFDADTGFSTRPSSETIALTSDTNTMTTGAAKFTIGDRDTTSLPFTGDIAHVLILPRLITQAEIDWLHNGGAFRSISDIQQAANNSNSPGTNLWGDITGNAKGHAYFGGADDMVTDHGGGGNDATKNGDPTDSTGVTTSRLLTDVSAAGIDLQGENAPVYRWEDLSGEDNHAVQATYANQPVYDYNTADPIIKTLDTTSWLTSTFGATVTSGGSVAVRGLIAGDGGYLHDGLDASNRWALLETAAASTWTTYGGTTVTHGTSDTSAHTWFNNYDTATDSQRVDGSGGSSDTGTHDLTGCTVLNAYGHATGVNGSYVKRLAVSDGIWTGTDITDAEYAVENGFGASPPGGSSVPALDEEMLVGGLMSLSGGL